MREKKANYDDAILEMFRQIDGKIPVGCLAILFVLAADKFI